MFKLSRFPSQPSTQTLSQLLAGSAMLLCLAGCASVAPGMKQSIASYVLDYDTPVDAALQARVEAVDARLRGTLGMTPEQTAVGVLDLQRLRLVLIHPDRIDYAASVPKIGILLAYFALHPTAATNLDATTRHELEQMIKVSSNEVAAKHSRAMGLKAVQQVLNTQGLYATNHGGGIWVGKHYGQGDERYGDPVGGHSHAATIRQLLRFYLWLEQGRLVSPEASRVMREIFEAPAIPHRDDKFVKGLAGRDVQIRRKAGWWENWYHDTAVISGGGRHYILVALTHHPKGDAYLEQLARAVDDLINDDTAR